MFFCSESTIASNNDSINIAYYLRCINNPDSILSPRLGYYYKNLAVIYGHSDKHYEAIKYYKKAIEVFKLQGNLNELGYINWYMAFIYQTSNANDSALLCNISALEYFKACNNSKEIIKTNIGIAYVYFNLIDPFKASQHIRAALDLSEKFYDQENLVEIYKIIASYFSERNNHKKAKEYYIKCLELSTGNYSCSFNKSLAETELQLKNYSMAEMYANRYIKCAILPGTKGFGFALLGKIYKVRGNIDTAKYLYYEALNLISKDKRSKSDFIPDFIEYGEFYESIHNNNRAIELYNTALISARNASLTNETSRSLFYLGRISYHTKNTKDAENYLLESFAIAGDNNDVELLKDNSGLLKKIYAEQGKLRLTYEYAENYINYSNILNERAKINDENELEFRLQLDEYKNETKAATDKQRIVRNYLIFLIVFVCCFGIFFFINYRRKRRDNKLLIQQKQEIESISNKLHEADQAKLKFFTNISHEFRTPLTLILGPIKKLIKEDTVSESKVSLYKIIQRNTYQLYNLINQLLDIRKLDAGNVILKITRDDIVACCKGIYSMFYHFSEEKEITYRFISTEETIKAWFDHDILDKILNNLLSNAFKYTPSGGEISVTLSRHHAKSEIGNETTHVKIIVCDNGKGIPEDQTQYVFDRYYQIENINTGFNTGTGIGLAYTKELIELHKGTITVNSIAGHGTTFTVTLPVRPSYYTESEELPVDKVEYITENGDFRHKYLEAIIEIESGTVKGRISPGKEGKVMLIIEDNNDLRTFIKNIFEKDFTIYEASEGLSGSRLASETIPDIIICDIMMPVMNGLELCAKLKGNIHTSHIPVLLLTAKADSDSELEGLNTGADDYITKPFDSDILEARVNGLLLLKQKYREYFTREFLMNPKEVKLPSPRDEFLKKAVKIVEDNITNPDLNYELLMEELFVSRTQLFRKLKAITNFSASEFIRNIRLKKAAQLLKQNSLSVTEIMILTGFNNHSYFTGCFREMYGCKPKEYSLKSENLSNIQA
jgi:signal transduction histidine kinase/DNA-binding response OmpR family regulator